MEDRKRSRRAVESKSIASTILEYVVLNKCPLPQDRNLQLSHLDGLRTVETLLLALDTCPGYKMVYEFFKLSNEGIA